MTSSEPFLPPHRTSTKETEILKTLIARLSRSHLVVGIVLSILLTPITLHVINTVAQIWVINSGQFILNIYITAFAAMILLSLWSMAMIDIKIGLREIRR